MESYAVPTETPEDDSASVIRIIRICRKCGAKILSDAPEKLCIGCVLEAALKLPNDVVAGCDEPGVADDTTASEAPLGELGDYELLEEIGRGGQGVVFRARQKSLNRVVALKVIGLGQWATKAHLSRFRREAEAAARLDHPGIVPIYEVGEREGSCYFGMKFIEGGQLDEVVRQTPFSLRQAAELIAKIARTVHHAHEQGIVHRDIKPGNVLLDAKGEPHLTDFGLARLVEAESTVTRTLEVMGTPSYMAPEQAAGNHASIGRETDVYGLGAVLYQLLTGHPPFAGGTTYETIRLLLETEPRPPRLWNRRIDRDLSTICLKSLAKEPARRYPSALALAEDLERWLKHEPIAARPTRALTRGGKWVRRNPTGALLATALVALAAIVGWNVKELVRSPVTTGIAVLPFKNLSAEKENGALVDGLQDDLLTRLAKIGQLKVISRTSVMEYRGQQNVRQIGEALRISHVLEGSARRNGNRIHFNAQLIDTRSDTHVWAEQYDCDLQELFALQSEIAQKVAAQLHATLSSSEQLAIQRKPTADLVAFELYSRANEFISGKNNSWANYDEAIGLLNQAVARDPAFLEAYCLLAYAHDTIYFNEVDHTPARLKLARAAIQAAFRIRPNAGEAHLAQALHLYRGYRDYDGALAELEVARQTLPNNAPIFRLMGSIQRRDGQWEEMRRNLEHAAALDPRDAETLGAISFVHQQFGRTAEARGWLTRAAAVAEPDDLFMKLALPIWELEVNADPRPLHEAIASIRATNPAALKSIVAVRWLQCALVERDAAAVKEALSALRDDEIWIGGQVQFNRPFVEGLIALMSNDQREAGPAFVAARAQQEKVVRAQPEFGPPWVVLGLIDAALGRKEEALREGRRALELLPVEKDAMVGSLLIIHFAAIAAWVGEKDLACQQLMVAIAPPRFLSYGGLKLSPLWDPLRGEPCFEKIVASLAPAERP